MSNTNYWFKTYLLNLKILLKSFQIETYCLIILPITWILISSFFENSVLYTLLKSKENYITWSFFYGGYLFKTGFLFFYLYIYFRIFIWLGHWLGKKIFKDGTASTIHLKQFLLSIMYIVLTIGLYNSILSLSLNQIAAAASRASIITTSQLYMAMDEKVFGFSPQLWIQKLSMSNILDYLLIQSYSKLPLFLAIVLMGFIFFNMGNFRKFLIALFIAPFIAMPFWYVWPAVSPNEMYRHNMFSLQSISETQKQYEEAVTGKRLKVYLHLLEKDIQNPKQKNPLVFTNPSMHVAWGAIITYFAIILWWPLGFIFIPWFILNMLSTLYTLQHYAVDLPTGLVCAMIAIIVTNYLFKFEKKYYTGKYRSFYFINVIQDDIEFLRTRMSTMMLRLKYKFS